MYTIYQSKALILDAMDIGEKNRFFWLFTRDFGLIHASAQSVRSSSSKLNAHLQTYGVSIIEFVRGKELWRITNALPMLDEPYSFSLLTTKSQEVIVRVSILLRRLYVGEEAHPELFDEIISGFEILSQTFDSKTTEAIETLLMLKVLYYLGYWEEYKEHYPLHTSPFSPEILDRTLHKKEELQERIKHSLRESHL